MEKSIAFVKEQGNDYMDLYGRALVDIAMDLIIGYLFCSQASTSVEMEVSVAADNSLNEAGTITMKERKKMVAHRFIRKAAVKNRERAAQICSGETSTFHQFSELIGPVPAVE